MPSQNVLFQVPGVIHSLPLVGTLLMEDKWSGLFLDVPSLSVGVADVVGGSALVIIHSYLLRTGQD